MPQTASLALAFRRETFSSILVPRIESVVLGIHRIHKIDYFFLVTMEKVNVDMRVSYVK